MSVKVNTPLPLSHLKTRLLNVVDLNPAANSLVGEGERISVAREDLVDVGRNIDGAVADMDCARVFPVSDVDLCRARVVREIHVVEDDRFVHACVESFEAVDVAHEESRTRRMRLGPRGLAASRLSFEHKNPMSISVESKACQRLTHLSGNMSVFTDGELVITT